MIRYVLPMIVLSWFVSQGTNADEGPWSRFRGPNGAGISDATGPNKGGSHQIWVIQGV